MLLLKLEIKKTIMAIIKGIRNVYLLFFMEKCDRKWRSMNLGKKYRYTLIVLLVFNIVAIVAMLYYKWDTEVPDNLRLVVNQKGTFNFEIPAEASIESNCIEVLQNGEKKLSKDILHVDMQKPFEMSSSKTGIYRADLKLFGILKIKEINIQVIDEMEVIPSGLAVGIEVKTKGVLILGTGAVSSSNGEKYEPALNIVKSGDYIIAVNEKEISSKQEIVDQVQKSEGKKIILTILRNDEKVKVAVTPVSSGDGIYKLGIWVREDTQGIGTLTYVDDNGEFRALGHGITDIDTGMLMDIKSGNIYYAGIMDIVKGESGAPGEIVGYINKTDENKIGTISKNTMQGISGIIENKSVLGEAEERMPIGFAREVKEGKAYIKCQVGDKVDTYEIEIEKVKRNAKNTNKSLVIKITDEKLLNQTNGIIQGMSGSPIIQNGKLVGAVTHVFVRDPAHGYGTLIENMIQLE